MSQPVDRRTFFRQSLWSCVTGLLAAVVPSEAVPMPDLDGARTIRFGPGSTLTNMALTDCHLIMEEGGIVTNNVFQGSPLPSSGMDTTWQVISITPADPEREA